MSDCYRIPIALEVGWRGCHAPGLRGLYVGKPPPGHDIRAVYYDMPNGPWYEIPDWFRSHYSLVFLHARILLCGKYLEWSQHLIDIINAESEVPAHLGTVDLCGRAAMSTPAQQSMAFVKTFSVKSGYGQSSRKSKS